MSGIVFLYFVFYLCRDIFCFGVYHFCVDDYGELVVSASVDAAVCCFRLCAVSWVSVFDTELGWYSGTGILGKQCGFVL